MPKISRFWRVFENSVTSQVSFNKTKFVENAKIKIKCNILNYFQTMWSGLFLAFFRHFLYCCRQSTLRAMMSFRQLFVTIFIFYFSGKLFPLHRIVQSITPNPATHSSLDLLLDGQHRKNPFQNFRCHLDCSIHGFQRQINNDSICCLQICSY